MNNINTDDNIVKKGDNQLLKNVKAFAARLVKEKLSVSSIFVIFELWVFTEVKSFFTYTDSKEDVESNFWEHIIKMFAFIITLPISILLWLLAKPIICLSCFFILTILIANKLWL